jgi:predicted PurR-regulated permease PerM
MAIEGLLMDQLNFSYVSIILAILCLFFLILTILIKKKNTRLTEQLRETKTTLDMIQEKLTDLQEKNREFEEFHDSLKVAQLTTKLQKPRLHAQCNETSSSTPGKYSSIQALVRTGMSIEEIALTLAISTHEAQQLVNLAKLAQENSADNVRVGI